MSLFPRRPRPAARRTRVPPGKARSRIAKHAFTADATMPPDHRGRKACGTCGCIGEAGDGHHYGPDDTAEQYPEQDPETRQLELRRYGERDND